VKRAMSWPARTVARQREGGVALSSCRCLFVRRSWCAAKLDKEGGQPDETGLDQSGIAFCSADEEVLLGALSVLFCGWREGISVEDVSCCVLRWGRRMLRMSFFCRVRT
jgi:hypothetical protein